MSPCLPYEKLRTFVGRFILLKVLFRRRPSRSPTTRSVTSMEPETARAHLRSAAALGSPRTETANWTASLFFLRVLGVGIDDARHQRMAHHILRAELGERDAAHAGEDPARLDQAALLAAREVDLRDVAVHHRLGAEADAREEHLHLLGGGVLRFVEDHEGMVERAPAHVGERRELDGAALEELAGFLEAHQVVERVVQRPQIRIDLLRAVTRQKAER